MNHLWDNEREWGQWVIYPGSCHLFVRLLLRAEVQPTLDLSAETS